MAVDFANSTGGGLGAGLPAGTVRIYERDAAGAPKFVGEAEIDATPQGSELSLKFGDAFDVTVQPTAVGGRQGVEDPHALFDELPGAQRQVASR